MIDADYTAIRSVVERQLEAFQKDDALSAFAFASPGIQAQFQDPERFMAMVKTTYRTVYRPRSVMFEKVTLVRGEPTQIVVFLDGQGKLLRAYYLMEQQADKTWRIAGCYLVSLDEPVV
ncbi:DUF4864 domain-containing protein [Anthocerotibacter panamensis]|uniref:DUF4864 domain-containing protein n=1 Tax=Anthocerotibacter panamensis TaxID=2857077 RepID=UPI001C405E2F|nr:DUF4864 domain-containing protein [Anthocerotibacter panamensis]